MDENPTPPNSESEDFSDKLGPWPREPKRDEDMSSGRRPIFPRPNRAPHPHKTRPSRNGRPATGRSGGGRRTATWKRPGSSGEASPARPKHRRPGGRRNDRVARRPAVRFFRRFPRRRKATAAPRLAGLFAATLDLWHHRRCLALFCRRRRRHGGVPGYRQRVALHRRASVAGLGFQHQLFAGFRGQFALRIDSPGRRPASAA